MAVHLLTSLELSKLTHTLIYFRDLEALPAIKGRSDQAIIDLVKSLYTLNCKAYTARYNTEMIFPEFDLNFMGLLDRMQTIKGLKYLRNNIELENMAAAGIEFAEFDYTNLNVLNTLIYHMQDMIIAELPEYINADFSCQLTTA